MLDAATQSLLAAKDAQIGALTAQLQVLSEALRDLTAALNKTTAAAPTVTLKEIFDAYEKIRRKDHSWKWTSPRLEPLIRHLGSLPAMQLTPKKWASHVAIRLGEYLKVGENRMPSSGTIVQELIKAKALLNWACLEDQGLIPFNPLKNVRRPKGKPPRKTWLPEAEIQKLMDAPRPTAAHARMCVRALVAGKADTGLRLEEVRRLRRDRTRWRAADKRWVIDIPQTKNRKSHVVAVTQRFKDALDAIPEVLGSPYYLSNANTRRPYAASWLRTQFYEATESSGVDVLVAEGEKRIKLHDMRRSAASNAHVNGATLLEIQDMLNHSTPAITAQYVQRNENNAVKMARLMEKGTKSAKAAARKPPHRSTSTDSGLAPNEKKAIGLVD